MNNREKKPIIIWFILALLIFTSFSLILVNYIYPNIMDIESQKVKLKKKNDKYNQLDLKWFDFKDFKELNNFYSSKKSGESEHANQELYDSLNEEFYKKIYKTINESSYNNSIYNWSYSDFQNTQESFVKYLQESDNRLTQVKNSKKFSDRKWNLSLVLPKYSIYVDLDSKDSLTDLGFINYIETLLKKFNLRTKSSIWIKSIIIAKNEIVNDKDNIFYIPLDLEITWNKIWIIDFLKYIKRSWSIEFRENDFDFKNEDWKISQLSEIESFEINKYIDSSLQKRAPNQHSLKNFLLKTGQQNDIISANVKLRFYISGLSSEKIIAEINSIIWSNITKTREDKYWNLEKDEKTWEYKKELIHYNHSNILKIVKKLKSAPQVLKSAYYRKKVDNMFLYLNNKDLRKDMASIKKQMKKLDNLNNVYLTSLKYKDIFSKIDKDVYSIVNSLWINKEKFYPKNYIFK